MERDIFDEVADVYDQSRPAYPDQLFYDLVGLAGIDHGSRALEVGTGTGQATRGLARRGIPILGLEPGPRLASIARANLRSFSQVRVVTESFESWSIEAAGFDLVFSAQAFHWVAPEVRFVKAWQALKEGGSLAIIANVPYHGKSELDRVIDECYQQLAPSYRSTGSERRDTMESEFQVCPLFRISPVRRYEWSASYTAEEYITLLSTYSDHRILPEAERSALFSGISSAILAHGCVLKLQYESKLLLGLRLN